jgi:ubiquitin-conjugating enzyme E2 Q
MCMELLTNSGWSSASSIESVLLQVRMAISNTEPQPARLEAFGKQHPQQDYGVQEAMDAYVRACRLHGWEVPKDFKEFASSGGGSIGL